MWYWEGSAFEHLSLTAFFFRSCSPTPQNKRLLDQMDGLLPLFEDSARITFAAVEDLVRDRAEAEAKKPAEDAGENWQFLKIFRRFFVYGGKVAILYYSTVLYYST